MRVKHKGKSVKMLQPENYIRQRARTLPVYECWTNNNWKEKGMANIMVARKHNNGNITMGMYLVDLRCLGVKAANSKFNISELEYREILEHANNTMEMEAVSYVLAHNIVFAAISFAEEFGFKPHRDFTEVAQYILEEDTEEIELMDIECGIDGKPQYIKGPHESGTYATQIIAQLERTAGPGNYSFMNEADWDPDEDESFDEFLDDESGDNEAIK
jgi:hypothetical protein